MIRNLETSLNSDELIVTVAPAWDFAPRGVRLRSAQHLWQLWAQVHSSLDWDKARIQIIDVNGNQLGGSGLLAGSSISVK